MQSPPAPHDEPTRLAALHALRLLDTEPEERFDRFARLARRLFDVPIALVTLVDSNRQWFKSRVGFGASETSREVSFCAHTILSNDVFVVPDASTDERFFDNPLVTGDPKIRFYAGHPLHGPDGHRIGTVCLIDRRPRTLDDEEIGLLRDVTAMVASEVAALLLATTDDLTGLSNRRGFLLLASKSMALCERHGTNAALILMDLDNFKAVNDTHGHAAGDVVLADMGSLLLNNFRDSDVVARLGGDEFAVLMTGVHSETIDVPLERLRREVAHRNLQAEAALAYSVGVAQFEPSRDIELEALIELADRALYAAKKKRVTTG